MRASFRGVCRRRWGSWWGLRGRGCWRCRSRSGSACCAELLEQEVDEVVGPKGKWNPDRTAVRHGHETGEVTLGGRRVAVERPRVRTADGESEMALRTYEHFAERDQLEDVVLERMLAGVSTRRYRRVQEPVGERVEGDARSTSKSAVSRGFVHRTRAAAVESDEPPAVGSAPRGDDARRDRACTGTRTSSRWGSPPRARSSRSGCGRARARTRPSRRALLADLVDRGLDVEQGMLFVIDGSKATAESHPTGVRQRRARAALRTALSRPRVIPTWVEDGPQIARLAA